MAATAYRDTDLVQAGVGLLYVAPLGTTTPTNATATLDPAWREIGYTDTGATIGTETETEEIEVAEETSPIRTVVTKITGSLEFAMAQATASNLALALNLGADVDDNVSSVAPPEAGEDVSVMLLLQSTQGARWVFYSGKNSAGLSLERVKTGKTLIPVTFAIEKVTGKNLFDVFPSPEGLI